jgi:5-formyltetrahydrofolate cyclo-ligase
MIAMSTAEKDVIRHEAKLHRDRINPFSEDIDAATEHFFESINPTKEQVVSFYWPKGREFPPTAIIERLLKENYLCALPVIQKDKRELLFAEWDENIELEKGPFDVMQPVIEANTSWVDPDVLIVPLLAFDRRGHRMGYGKGHYDATIASLRKKNKKFLTVGLCYAQQAVLFNLPTEAHDEPLDWVVTPTQAHKFREES